MVLKILHLPTHYEFKLILRSDPILIPLHNIRESTRYMYYASIKQLVFNVSQLFIVEKTVMNKEKAKVSKTVSSLWSYKLPL